MTTQIFYKKPVILDRNLHKDLKMGPSSEFFSYAKETNSVLLAVTEFADASRDYPIVFVSGENGSYTVAALVGLTLSENLMVASDGKWKKDTYVPAFVRRYPFAFVETPEKDTLTVCLDEAYAGINTQIGTNFFNPDGTETDYLQQVVEFLNAFHADMIASQVFASKLAELGLLSSKAITVELEGKKSSLDGFWVVDEKKLLELTDAQVGELVRLNYMGLIYAHFLSLRNVVRLAMLKTA